MSQTKVTEVKAPKLCVIFINDTPNLIEDPLEAALTFAEDNLLYPVMHFRTKHGNMRLSTETVIENTKKFISKRPDVSTLLLVNCSGWMFSEVMSAAILDILWDDRVDVRELEVKQRQDFK